MSNEEIEIKPKTQKSNLDVKSVKRRRKKVSTLQKNRKEQEFEKVLNADVIFGLDNGATGTVACIIPYSEDDTKIYFEKTFHNIELDYQKDINYIARIDWEKLKKWFETIIKTARRNYIKKYNKKEIKISIIMERPMINADRFKQSKNAARAFESTLMVLEMLGLNENYIIIDSKKWQHYFFGKNTTLIDLKVASKDEGVKFLNDLSIKKYKKEIEIINNHGDADSLLICKWAFEKFCL
jgi:hypothetical protein